MITCEIDQFLCVISFINVRDYDNRIGVISRYCKIVDKMCEYIPKELFNMTQIEVIGFTMFGRCSSQEFIINHYLRMWNNLVNLRCCFNISSEFYTKQNGYIKFVNRKA